MLKNYKNVITEACNRLERGDSVKTVANAFNVKPGTVKTWQQKYGKNEKRLIKRSWKYDNNTILEACGELKRGVPIRPVAKKFGISEDTLLLWKYKYLGYKKDSKQVGNEKKDDVYTKLVARKLLSEGKSAKVIAKELDVDIKWVQKWRKKELVDNGIQIMDGWKYDKSIIVKACKLLEQGETPPFVAKKFNVPLGTVRSWILDHVKKQKSKVTNGYIYDKNLISKICKRLKQGESLASLSREFKISATTIAYWKRKYRIEKESISKPKTTKTGIKKDAKLNGKPIVALVKDPKIDIRLRKVVTNY